MINNFMVLILTHLVSDWFFQPTKWALGKHKSLKYRFYHCVQYSLLFLPILYLLELNLLWFFWIFATHLLIDSYVIVRWWGRILGDKKSPMWLQTVRDQILHILVLLPIVLI